MITSRQQRILHQLMESSDYISFRTLMDQYGVSERTARHDLLQLEDWLRDHSVELERHRTKGVKLQHNQEQIRMLEQKLTQRPAYMDSEQRKTVLLKLLLQKNTYAMEQVLDDFGISNSTLLTDLAELKEWLAQRSLSLKKSKGILAVEGNEQARRSAYLELLRAEITEDKLLRYMFDRDNLEPPSLSHLNKWFKAKDVQVIFDSLQQLEHIMNIQFADAGYSTITLHLLMAIERLKHAHTVHIDQQLLAELQGKEVFQLIQNQIAPFIESHFNVKLPMSEIAYITQHVLGAQKKDVQSKDAVLLQLAEEIVNRTEAELGYRLRMTEQAVKGLSIHLNPAIYRAKFNLQLKNPLMSQLEQQYGSLLQLLEHIVNDVIASLGISFDRDEIGYIMLHIASGIVPQVLNMNKRVAIVCASGIGTSAMIKRRLTYVFPQLEVVRVCSYKEAADLTYEEADAILTTIHIGHALPIPCLKVSPLLTEQDQQMIAGLFHISPKEDEAAATAIQVVNDIMKIVEGNAVIHDRGKLLEELLFMLQGAGAPRSSSGGAEQTLSKLLPPSSITLELDVTDWESAIRAGSQLLIDKGVCNKRYEQKLVEMIHAGNHSFLLQPGIYFPHAYIPEHVAETAFSLVTFRKPVLFGPAKHPVWLMITLAATDKEKHVTALGNLMEILNDEECIQLLQSAADPNVLWERLRMKEEVT